MNSVTQNQQDWKISGDVNIENTNQNINILSSKLPEAYKFFPYLANRESQTFQLKKTTNDFIQSNKNCVIVCVIPGNINELHFGLMERFDKVILPEVLKSNSKTYGITPTFQMKWPNKSFSVNNGMLYLKDVLKNKLNNNSSNKETDVYQAVSSMNNNFSLRYNIYESNWNKHEKQLLEQWINFWLNLTPRTHGNLIQVFICVNYKHQSFFSKFKQLFRKSNLKQYMESLSNTNSENLICLDELQSLDNEDLHEWATSICYDNEIEQCSDSKNKIQFGILSEYVATLCPKNKSMPHGQLTSGMITGLEKACRVNLVER
jgi:hypothetical protein